jgi:hypothetical protein
VIDLLGSQLELELHHGAELQNWLYTLVIDFVLCQKLRKREVVISVEDLSDTLDDLTEMLGKDGFTMQL